VQIRPTIRKVSADSVLYGDAICTRGDHVWAAYDGEKLIAVGATADEARRNYRRAWAADLAGRDRAGRPSGGRGWVKS